MNESQETGNGSNGQDGAAPLDPRRTYEALGRFIERRSPYAQAILPDFGAGSLTGDTAAMQFEDDDPLLTLDDKHVLVEQGSYRDFNQGNPSNLKSELVEQQTPFPKYDLGDGVGRNVVKEVQIRYKHRRKVDGKVCYATMVVLYLGDAH